VTPHFFCISDTSNSLPNCSKNLKKFYRLGNFRANVDWVVLLLMPKIDRARKSYLTSEIWEEMLWEIFNCTLIFQQSSMICLGRHVGGHALALQHDGQNYFLLSLVKCLIVTFRCAINVTTSSLQHFPWSLSAKFASENGNSHLAYGGWARSTIGSENFGVLTKRYDKSPFLRS